MQILITGGNGQLGSALQSTLHSHSITSVDLPEIDISDFDTIEKLIASSQPDIVINAAAYTNVDGCVKEPKIAYRANALGPQNIALICSAHGIPMVQISTNEVFDGHQMGGYEEWHPLTPGNAYGRSKAAGEFNVRSVLPQHYIVRTAWLYAPGGRNFVHAILRRAKERAALKVVTDEIGNPTAAGDLAAAIGQLIETGRYGTYHFVNEGHCSRWTFANEILKAAGLDDVPNQPILSSEFQRASTPPPFGVLHNINGAQIGIQLPPWEQTLHASMKDLLNE